MSAADSIPTTPAPRVAHPEFLAQQTQGIAEQLYQTVGNHYLAFRRGFFHDANPSLATEPPAHPDAHQTETAKLAENALRVVPSAAQSLPILGDLVVHLQRVIDIHTLTENELLTLHNVTMIYLYGVRDGIQGWYVDYLLDAAMKLQHEKNPDYFIEFPWHGLFYLPPDEAAAFSLAVQQGDITGITNQVQQLGNRLSAALENPFKAQEDLAFAGEDGERRKTIFTLKTTAGLAIGAYLAIEAVRAFVGPHHPHEQPQAVVQIIPAQMQQYLIPRDQLPPQASS